MAQQDQKITRTISEVSQYFLTSKDAGGCVTLPPIVFPPPGEGQCEQEPSQHSFRNLALRFMFSNGAGREIFSISEYGILVLDDSHRILYLNDAAAGLLGLNKDSLKDVFNYFIKEGNADLVSITRLTVKTAGIGEMSSERLSLFGRSVILVSVRDVTSLALPSNGCSSL